MEAEPLRYHGPGWWVRPSTAREYLLWAPRPAGEYDGAPHPAREGWSAHWSRRRGFASGSAKSGSAIGALACFPTDREGRAARAALQAAADAYTEGCSDGQSAG
jgi:hypothetical protein